MAKENSTRVSIYMNPSILEKIDAHADKLGLSRSSAISVIVYEYFRTEEASEAMANINKLQMMISGQNLDGSRG